jgi:hypothetical protein
LVGDEGADIIRPLSWFVVRNPPAAALPLPHTLKGGRVPWFCRCPPVAVGADIIRPFSNRPKSLQIILHKTYKFTILILHSADILTFYLSLAKAGAAPAAIAANITGGSPTITSIPLTTSMTGDTNAADLSFR